MFKIIIRPKIVSNKCAQQGKKSDVVVFIKCIFLDVVKNNCKIKKGGSDQAANKYSCYFLQL
jgi:hypothetical protein